jgi:antitoxin YefM
VIIVTAEEAREDLDRLLEEVSASHEPIQIAGERGSAVLVGEGDWRAVQETLRLVSIPGTRSSLERTPRAKRAEPHRLRPLVRRPKS